MATVFELSEPYRNHLVPIVPRGRGVCTVCWTAVEPTFSLCYQCNIARSTFSRRRLANVVVPIALAVKREQLAHELWHYKYDTDATVRTRLETRLAAVLWRFLGEHESHIAAAVDVAGFDVVTTVPGTRQRDDEHPLVRIVGSTVGQTRDRYERLLKLGPSTAGDSRAVLLDRYHPTRELPDHTSVLLIDDTWTRGGRAQSAVLALRDAGAATVAVAVMGRHFDRTFGAGEAYYQQARRRKFMWEQCCLEYRTDETPPELCGCCARSGGPYCWSIPPGGAVREAGVVMRHCAGCWSPNRSRHPRVLCRPMAQATIADLLHRCLGAPPLPLANLAERAGVRL